MHEFMVSNITRCNIEFNEDGNKDNFGSVLVILQLITDVRQNQLRNTETLVSLVLFATHNHVILQPYPYAPSARFRRLDLKFPWPMGRYCS